MIEIKKNCNNCHGKKRYIKTVNKETGQKACFICFGRGYFVEQVDEDTAARIELMQTKREQLELVDCDTYKWVCHIEGCERYTKVKDFGIAPMYYTRWGWEDLSKTRLICHPHNRMKLKGTPRLPSKPGSGEKHLIPLLHGTSK